MIVLGIETTCDETAAAVVERSEQGRAKILSNIVLSQVSEHAAEGRVLAHLAKDDIGQDFGAALLGTLDHRRRGLVAGGLDAEDDHSIPTSCLSRSGRGRRRLK